MAEARPAFKRPYYLSMILTDAPVSLFGIMLVLGPWNAAGAGMVRLTPPRRCLH